MDFHQLPQDVLGSVVDYLVRSVSLGSALRLRLVSRSFNQEILRQMYLLDSLDFYNSWITKYDRKYIMNESSAVRYLHGFLARVCHNSQHVTCHTLLNLSVVDLEEIIPVENLSSVTIDFQANTLQFHAQHEWKCRRILSETVTCLFHSQNVLDSFSYLEQTAPQTLVEVSELCWSMFVACYMGNVELFKVCFNRLPESARVRAKSLGLYMTLRRGHLKLSQLIVSMGVDVNQSFLPHPSKKWRTAIYAAFESGSDELIDLLLEHGVSRTGPEYNWVIRYALADEDQYPRARTARRLYASGYNLEDEVHDKMFRYAVWRKDTELIDQLLNHANIDVHQRRGPSGSREPLGPVELAVQTGDMKLLKRLCEHPMPPIARLYYGKKYSELSVIQVAVENDLLETLEIILPTTEHNKRALAFQCAAKLGTARALSCIARSIDIFRHPRDSTDPPLSMIGIYEALKGLNVQTAEWFLEKGINPEQRVVIDPLQLNKRSSDLSVLKSLLEKYGLSKDFLLGEMDDTVPQYKGGFRYGPPRFSIQH